MRKKTEIFAEDNSQSVLVTRVFDLPLELLFMAYEDPRIIEQWMGTKVLTLENKNHGSWRFQTTDEHGNVVFQAHGVYHEFSPNQKITRTFEMENSPFPVQLEYMEFEALTQETSKLSMLIVYKSSDYRDQMLQLPFASGLNSAHDRLQDVASKLNNIS